MKNIFFASLFLSIATAGAAVAGIPVRPATITLSPVNPRPGDIVTATIHGRWSDSCAPSAATVTVIGRTIRIEARVTPCNTVCLPAVTNYTLTTTFQAPPGESGVPYMVEYLTIDCFQRRSLDATAQLVVRSEACTFAESLTVNPNAVRAGEQSTLSWCNPGVIIPDATFGVSFYRVYHSRTATGPFSVFAELQGQSNTSTQFASRPSEIGSHYFYVEAHGCTTTITGECRPTIMQTEIVSLTVASANGCMPNATTLCLADGRFAVNARWRTADGNNGDGRPVQLTADSGYFWFFNPENVEVTVKVLNACSLATPRLWVFASGMTNVEVELFVFDTAADNIGRTYKNPQGMPFVPVLDTNAFDTCR